ncbi:hypothetical protein ES703_64225 [subsurface metagenome]
MLGTRDWPGNQRSAPTVWPLAAAMFISEM